MGKINRPKLEMLNCIKKMPPLKHVTKDQGYDIMKSEVIDWIVSQPEVRKWLYRKVGDSTGGKNPEFIKFNKDTGTWQGVDYDES